MKNGKFIAVAVIVAIIAIGATVVRAQDTTKDNSQGGHVGTNGVREELLTGDTAERARAAAVAAVPSSTVVRVETDAEGSPYEAHMRQSDGTPVTVKFDSNFNVTTVEKGHGRK